MKFEEHVLIDVSDVSKGVKKETITKNSILLNYPCSSVDTCTPYILTLNPGRYQFECWGSRGNGNGSPGFGAYTSGVLNVRKLSTFFVFIGAAGTFNSIPKNLGSFYYGGGATDVRLSYANTWYNTNSLITRIMVAAGGGAAEWGRSMGGNGGAPTGGYGYTANGVASDAPIFSPPIFGATNTKGGYCTSTYTVNGIARTIFQGTFGVAGYSTSTTDIGGIGGGGYYGGGTPDYGGGGSGGSSFVSGHSSCNSVKNSTTITPSNSSVHYSGLRFVNPKMIEGNTTMPLPTGGSGKWSGTQGAFRLTILSLKICSTSSRKKVRVSVLLIVFLTTK